MLQENVIDSPASMQSSLERDKERKKKLIAEIHEIKDARDASYSELLQIRQDLVRMRSRPSMTWMIWDYARKNPGVSYLELTGDWVAGNALQSINMKVRYLEAAGCITKDGPLLYATNKEPAKYIERLAIRKNGSKEKIINFIRFHPNCKAKDVADGLPEENKYHVGSTIGFLCKRGIIISTGDMYYYRYSIHPDYAKKMGW